MKNMMAYQVQQNHVKLIEQEVPTIAADEVLVKMHALAINHRDYLVVNGVARWKPSELGKIPIADGAGEVVRIGDSVQGLSVGDRVSSLIVPNWQDGPMTLAKLGNSPGGPNTHGVGAQFVAFKSQAVIKIPESLSYQEAATLPCAGLTAWNAVVEQSSLKPGDTVLILGTGGVSLFSLQFALMMGCEVIVTSSSNEKLEQARLLGAHHVINYKENSSWTAKVLSLTGGSGVDYIAEVVGGSHLNLSLECIKTGGIIAQIGAIKGVVEGSINTAEIMYKAVQIKGIEVGSKAMHQRMLKAIDVHKMKPVIDKVFGFYDLNKAVDYQGSGGHFGKIVVSLN